jgi:hypothetical protein
MKGTAQRTENPIIVETPGPVVRSAPVIATAMTMDIGTEMSQNNLQPLMALFFSTTGKSILMVFNRLQKTGVYPL